MVVPYAAGGPADVIARVIAPGMSLVLGQQVIVENVVGAGGITGAEHVAHAPPDGYQFLFGVTGVLAFNQSLYKHPPYNSAMDFAPVGLVATSPPLLITRKDFPDFISTALPQVRSGAVKAIATLTRERTPMLPALATADEQGLSGFDAPGGTRSFFPRGHLKWSSVVSTMR